MPDNYMISDGLMATKGSISGVFKLNMPDIKHWNSGDKEAILSSLSGDIARALTGETFSFFTIPTVEDNAVRMEAFDKSVNMYQPGYSRPEYVETPPDKEAKATFLTVQINTDQQELASLKEMVSDIFKSISKEMSITENMIRARRTVDSTHNKISRYFEIAHKDEIEYYAAHINRNKQGFQVFDNQIMHFEFEVLSEEERDLDKRLYAMIIEITDFPKRITIERFQWHNLLPQYCELANNCHVLDKEKMRRRLGREKGDLNFEKEQATSVSQERKEEFASQIDDIDEALELLKDPNKALAITSSAVLITSDDLTELKKRSSAVQSILSDNKIESRIVFSPAKFYVEHFKKRKIASDKTCLVEIEFIVAAGLPVESIIGD